MIGLDTNTVIAAINRRAPGVRPRLEAAIAAGVVVGISTIVLFELRYGIIKSARPQENAAILEAFWRSMWLRGPSGQKTCRRPAKFVRILSAQARRSAPMMS